MVVFDNKQVNLSYPCWASHDPVKRKFLQRCSPPQAPGQLRALHSLTPVLATTFCWPPTSHKMNFFWLLMTLFADSPGKRLNIKSFASTAPWLAQMCFNICVSIAVRAVSASPSTRKKSDEAAGSQGQRHNIMSMVRESSIRGRKGKCSIVSADWKPKLN